MERRMKVAVTHDGLFHADDVFAAVVVRRMFPRVRIMRTRHPDHLAAADLRFDVGGKSDGATDFDHHQPGGAGVRPPRRLPWRWIGRCSNPSTRTTMGTRRAQMV